MHSYYRIQIISILVLLIWSCASDQDQIQYGSNNGKYVSVNGTRVYYEEYGSGIPLLLLHGSGTPMRNFRKVIPELSEHFRVIAIDNPGWGKSEHPDSLSCQLLADYYSEMIDILGLDSVYVFGYSMGGSTTFLLAYDRPDKVKRIAVSGATSNMDGFTQRIFDLLEYYDPEYLEQNETELAEYKNTLLEPENWKKSISDKRNMWLKKVVISDSQLEQLQCRALIMLGDRDSLCKLEHSIHLFRTIERSELCILPDTPHRTIIAKPNLINKILIDFLTKE